MNENQKLADITVGQVARFIAPLVWLLIGTVILSFLIDHGHFVLLVVVLVLHLFGVVT